MAGRHMSTMTAKVGAEHPKAALAQLARSARPMAIRICRRHSIPPQDAEDLMQQSLVALLDGKHEIENPEAWLAGTLRNHCLMYWRRRRRRLYCAVDSAVLEALAEPTPSDQQSVDFSYDIDRILKRLPSRCRSVLTLRYGLGCRPLETAERLGYRSTSIYKILERCLAAFSRSLTASGFVAGKGEAESSVECQLPPGQ